MIRFDPAKISPFKFTLTALFAAIVLASSLSCSPPADPMLDMLDTQLANLKVDSLSRTMQFVESPVRFQKQEFEEKLAASLNRWSKAESKLMTPDAWKQDSAADELVSRFGSIQGVKKLSELSFVNTDSYWLQQCFWFDRLAKRLVANTDASPFELHRLASGLEFQRSANELSDEEEGQTDSLTAILKSLHVGIDDEQAKQLADATKLFDWIVRNIHLLKDTEFGEAADAEAMRLNDAEDLAAAGVPGLGYTRFPWVTMLTSRGDYVDRAKIFMMMAEQQGINCVMLVPKDSDPWAVGIQVGNSLYLFDTKLGLPIPGTKPGSIATLSQIKKQTDLLTTLDLTVDESLKDDTKYWVKPEQLDELQGLVLASPESLSYRFWELERKLVGESQLNLVTEASTLIEQFPSIEGVTYGLWDIEFRTHQFRRALRDAIAQASFNDSLRDKIRWYFLNELYINEFVRYRTARSKYFVGLFDTIRNDGNLNAIELFYKMIYKDSKIKSLASDKIFQMQLALAQGATSATDFEATINGVQANMRLVRRDSGFFLSQCHFDNGNFGTAENWLTRLEEIDDAQRWQPAINYLRARSLEAQRNYAAAIETYGDQDSQQFHGNLIRARLLKELGKVSTPQP